MSVFPRICVVDYGMGNVLSVVNALKKAAECTVVVSDKKEDFENADILLLPGVGAFKDAMRNLHEGGFVNELNQQVLKNKKPVIAICLGMQLLMETSEEGGSIQGLGWIPGNVTRFQMGKSLRIPHMGWNNLNVKKSNDLFNGVEENPDFYFVHSYHINCDEQYVIASCDYGFDFIAAIKKDNIVAFQFHPEKSHKNGLRLLSNYLNSIKEQL